MTWTVGHLVKITDAFRPKVRSEKGKCPHCHFFCMVAEHWTPVPLTATLAEPCNTRSILRLGWEFLLAGKFGEQWTIRDWSQQKSFFSFALITKWFLLQWKQFNQQWWNLRVEAQEINQMVRLREPSVEQTWLWGWFRLQRVPQLQRQRLKTFWVDMEEKNQRAGGSCYQSRQFLTMEVEKLKSARGENGAGHLSGPEVCWRHSNGAGESGQCCGPSGFFRCREAAQHFFLQHACLSK